MTDVDLVFTILLGLGAVVVLLLCRGLGIFDEGKVAEIDYVVYIKVVPSFYGLCGTKIHELTISSDEWCTLIYDRQGNKIPKVPKGYILDHIKYK